MTLVFSPASLPARLSGEAERRALPESHNDTGADWARTALRQFVRTCARQVNELSGEASGELILGLLTVVAAAQTAVAIHKRQTFYRRQRPTTMGIVREFAAHDAMIAESVGRALSLEGLREQVLSLALGPAGMREDLLSWLYQYMLPEVRRQTERRDPTQVGHGKITGPRLLAATQFFTERYMVRHLVAHTLGPLWNGHSSVIGIRVADPAVGGGNFLVGAFSWLLRAAANDGQEVRDTAEMLVRYTLTGYDLDPVVARVAMLSIASRAARVLDGDVVWPTQITSGPGPTRDANNQRTAHPNDAGALDDAVIPELIGALRSVSPGRRAILTNPPFLGRRLMGKPLRDYISRRFPQANGDLGAAFIARCVELLDANDRLGVVHQTNWLRLDTFAAFRSIIAATTQVESIAELGARAFRDLSGEKAHVALSVLSKKQANTGASAVGGRAHDRRDECRTTSLLALGGAPRVRKIAALSDSNAPWERVTLDWEMLTDDAGPGRPGSAVPHMYREVFSRHPAYADVAKPMQGTSTGDNKQFVRFSWQAPASVPEWKLASKGGGYRKWIGRNEHVVWWGTNGERVQDYPSAALRNAERSAACALTFSDTGSSGLSVRLRYPGQVCIAAGPGIDVLHGNPLAHLAYLNSRPVSALLHALTPKLTVAAGYLKRLPCPASIPSDQRLAELAQIAVAARLTETRHLITGAQYCYGSPGHDADLYAWARDSITAVLHAERERLGAEGQIDWIVLESLALSTRERTRIVAEVGPTAETGRRSECHSTSVHMGRVSTTIVASLFDAAATFSGRRLIPTHITAPDGALRIGVEGPLEWFTRATRASLDCSYEALQQALFSGPEVLRLFCENLLHASVLDALGFTADRTWVANQLSIPDLIDAVSERLPVRNGRCDIPGGPVDLARWLHERLPSIHASVFHGSPILRASEGRLHLSRRLPATP